MNRWLLLLFATIAKGIATSALRASQGFRKSLPSLLVVTGYGVSFYFTERERPLRLTTQSAGQK